MNKICIKCNQEKDITLFRKDNRNICLDCDKLYHNEYRLTHKKEEKEYRNKNREILNQKRRERYPETKEKHNLNNRCWRKNNKQKILELNKQYYYKVLKNKPEYKVIKTLKRRILLAVRKQRTDKAYKSIELLGCSISDLFIHLQQTAINNGYLDFNINNYSAKDYHIDHIIPCSVFDLSDPVEQKQCFHWTNLQILSSRENISKSNKIIPVNHSFLIPL